jgi:hypothetical protein
MDKNLLRRLKFRRNRSGCQVFTGADFCGGQGESGEKQRDMGKGGNIEKSFVGELQFRDHGKSQK